MAEKNKNNNNSNKGGSLTDNLFDMLNPNNVMGNAQRVISSAVNVLEEEIAAGILAAKRIEKKVLNVNEVRDNPDDLMNRIRRDTHEAIDIFLDAFAALSKQIGLLNNTLAKNNGEAATEKNTAAAATHQSDTANVFSVIEADAPIKAGQSAKLFMSIGDPSSKETIKVQLHKNDLIGAANQKILSKNIIIKPATFSLKPGEEKEIEILIKIPATTKPGNYCSLLTVANIPSIKTVIEIVVTA